MDATTLLHDTAALLPPLIVLVTGLLILTLDLFLAPSARYVHEVVGLAGLLLALLAALPAPAAPQPVFMGMAVVDSLGAFFNVAFIVMAALTLLLSAGFIRREGMSVGEYHALVLLATTGFMLVAAAADLIVVFLAIETLSLATYVLAGLLHQAPRSQEAAFKYFVLGAFSSAFFLYGVATLYGAVGTTRLAAMAEALAAGPVSPLVTVGLALLLVGLGFKAAVVPFHVWVPDVYEGAPTAVTAFMSAGPKAAAFAALVRVFQQGLAAPALQAQWVPVVAVLAALTMILGNLVAIVQHSVKRMLAYSSIAHAGYALVALAAPGLPLAAAGLLFYLLAYALMALGAFTVLTVVAKQGDERHAFGDYAGLGYTHPLLAAAMALFMFALAGFPPTAGFTGKFYLFSAAVQAGYTSLALVGVLTSVVSVAYYARVVMAMYMQEPPAEAQPLRLTPPTAVALGLAALGTLYLGVFPGSVLRLAERAVQVLF